jgi:tRNA-binding protein
MLYYIYMNTISWQDFESVHLCVGTVLSARPLTDARKPAYVLELDFGPDIGVLTSSSQITVHYTLQSLIGRQVIAVVNFPPKQIGNVTSGCLVTGFYDADGAVVLAVPDAAVPNGTRLC